MSTSRHHTGWLSLIEVSGPFLSLPVLLRVFPQGLDAYDPDLFRDLRAAYEEWQDDRSGRRADPSVHRRWVRFVLEQVLELPDDVIAEGQAIPQTLEATVAEHGETLQPDIVVVNPSGGANLGRPRLLIHVHPPDQKLDGPIAGKHRRASPSTRIIELLRATGVRLGLVTNGERWMLVDAPRGETTGFACWYAHLWLDEQVTLRAFRSLLGARRLLAVAEDETLEAMLAEGAENRRDVTDRLGHQVRRAVEVLVRSLDGADRDHGRQLLAEVTEGELYEAAVTVMMRLVFLLCVEERELLLLGDPLHARHRAVSTLREQLRDDANRHGEEVLERRFDAWCRLLATFRAVQDDRMRSLAHGGHLSDPDRFPFLEGRQPGTSWRTHAANPPPVNDRIVLHLLESLQLLKVDLPGGGPAGTPSPGSRALDIEQIGHVYEGLLDRTARRAPEPMLGLQGARGKEPEVPLSELERLRGDGEDELISHLKKTSGRSPGALRNALKPNLDAHAADGLLTACEGDANLRDRVRPFAGLLRRDGVGHPVVIPAGGVHVTAGTDRRGSGTHYTPRSLTEPIVRHTLEPLVYVGPAEGKPRKEWRLRSAAELLNLRICDMACGAGAFLVEACRQMSERLADAWEDAEKRHPGAPGITPLGEVAEGAEQVIPTDPDERIAVARRLVSQRCLYGVDINPLAVEMAKLSLWLLTPAKNKPFTFLDHAIRCGDSLVGIRDLRQLEVFDLDGEGDGNPPFLRFPRGRIERAIELRRGIGERPAERPGDVEAQAELMRQAEGQIERLKWVADMLVAADFQGATAGERRAAVLENGMVVARHFDDPDADPLRREAAAALAVDSPLATQRFQLRPFHWPLEFPEVIVERGGFDAIVCNPPFMGAQRITGRLTTEYRDYLIHRNAFGARGRADLCAYFLLQASRLLRHGGAFGFLATNSIAQGATREVGLDQILGYGFSMMRAVRSRSWTGAALLEIAQVWARRGDWRGPPVLDDRPVAGIGPLLSVPDRVSGAPHPLIANAGRAFRGHVVLGMGFVLGRAEAERLRRVPANRNVVLPFLIGRDLNHRPDHSASRWIICFHDWPLDHDAAPDGYDGPVAADYPECLRIVRERVKPERDVLGRKGDGSSQGYAKWWWQHGRRAIDMRAAIQGLDEVPVIAVTSRTLSPTRVPSDQIIDQSIVVFAGVDEYALLISSLHQWWALQHGTSMRNDARYTPSDCFETYPFPATHDSPLATLGEAYHEHRRQVMLDRWEGLTRTYSRFHDPRETAGDVQRLRELHVEVDHAAAAAYGWTDLELGHGFHETGRGLRYTISDPARREVLSRLLQLNHERHAEEVARGLHEKRTGRGRRG